MVHCVCQNIFQCKDDICKTNCIIYYGIVNQKEKNKYNEMSAKFQRDLTEAQATVFEEVQRATRAQMELDSKEAENEQLMQRLALQTSDTASVNSSNNEIDDDPLAGECTMKFCRSVKLCC